MDIQLIIVILCVVAALFFMGRRFYRCLRKGQCSCGCEESVSRKSCQGCQGPKRP